MKRKLFSNLFTNFGRKPKNIQKNRGMTIDQIGMCYKTMDSNQRAALQTNETFFSNFKSIFFLNFGQKTKNIQKSRGVNIDQIGMSYISMDSSQRALQK